MSDLLKVLSSETIRTFLTLASMEIPPGLRITGTIAGLQRRAILTLFCLHLEDEEALTKALGSTLAKLMPTIPDFFGDLMYDARDTSELSVLIYKGGRPRIPNPTEAGLNVAYFTSLENAQLALVDLCEDILASSVCAHVFEHLCFSESKAVVERVIYWCQTGLLGKHANHEPLAIQLVRIWCYNHQGTAEAASQALDAANVEVVKSALFALRYVDYFDKDDSAASRFRALTERFGI